MRSYNSTGRYPTNEILYHPLLFSDDDVQDMLNLELVLVLGFRRTQVFWPSILRIQCLTTTLGMEIRGPDASIEDRGNNRLCTLEGMEKGEMNRQLSTSKSYLKLGETLLIPGHPGLLHRTQLDPAPL